jgi:hypothetical protein
MRFELSLEILSFLLFANIRRADCEALRLDYRAPSRPLKKAVAQRAEK